MSSALILSCSQGSEGSVPASISISSLPASTSYEDKYNGVDPSKDSATKFYSTDTTSQSSSNYSISLQVQSTATSYSPSEYVKSELKKLVSGYKGTSTTTTIENYTATLANPTTSTKGNAVFSSANYSSYVYCYYNAKTIVNSNVNYNQVSAVWALKGNDGWITTDWYKINGYLSDDGAFHTTAKDRDIRAACDNTIKKKFSSSTTKNIPSDAQLLYYTESTDNLDYERPIWSKNDTGSYDNLKSKFINLVSFGDSLSDNGNDKRKTLGILPNNPFWGGRFSSGLNWTDYVSQQLGVASYNWAYGGSETGNKVALGVVTSLKAQVQDYVDNKGVNNYGLVKYVYGGYGDPNRTLFSVWSGANNYFNFIAFKANIANSFIAKNSCTINVTDPKLYSKDNSYCQPFHHQNSTKEAGHITFKLADVEHDDDQFVNTTIADIESSVTTLVTRANAKYIIIPNLPQLASIPGDSPEDIALILGIDLPIAKAMNNRLYDITLTHNARLKNLVTSLTLRYPGVTFITLDIYAALNKALSDPQIYLSDSGSATKPIATPFSQPSADPTKNVVLDLAKVAANNRLPAKGDDVSKFPVPCYKNFMKISEITSTFEGVANLIGFGKTYTSNFYNISPNTIAAKVNTLCTDPQNYVFYDGVHPTTQIHALLGYALSKYILDNGK